MAVHPSLRPESSAGKVNGFNERSLIAERFRALRILREVADVKTVLAADLRDGGTVVVKTVASHALSPSIRMRLEHEAEVLSRVRDRRFVPLLSFG